MSSWYHQVNPEWLKARCGFLTSSTVSTLWPETPTGKKRKISNDDFIAAIYNSMEFDVTKIISRAQAARGHILESYAVMEYNLRYPDDKIHHWDDCLIHDDGCVAFSPDAMSVKQPEGFVKLHSKALSPVVKVVEIKSYEAGKHIVTARAGQKALERRQVATAMHVMKTAEQGALLLYNPRLASSALLVTEWSRDELQHELEIIHYMSKHWHKLVTEILFLEEPVRLGPSEEDILKELEEINQISI